jgi:hypothetical protein
MKPTPTSNFNVRFINEIDEKWDFPESSQYFEGIFTAVLNYTVSIEFIPEIDRSLTNWPPKFNEEKVEHEASYLDARLTTLTLASYAVTPNQSLAGQEETISPLVIFPDHPAYHEYGDLVIFYITLEEFETFSKEKNTLQEQALFPEEYDDFWRITNLKNYTIGQFIAERFVKSQYLSDSHAYILGQTSVAPLQRT